MKNDILQIDEVYKQYKDFDTQLRIEKFIEWLKVNSYEFVIVGNITLSVDMVYDDFLTTPQENHKLKKFITWLKEQNYKFINL